MATTVQLMWHVQICDLLQSLENDLRNKESFAGFELLSHEAFVEWVPGTYTLHKLLPDCRFNSVRQEVFSVLTEAKILYELNDTC